MATQNIAALANQASEPFDLAQAQCALSELAATAWMLAEKLAEHESACGHVEGHPNQIAHLIARQCRELAVKLGELDATDGRQRREAA